tara:strand:+ start:169 stop:1128 length:960 start_codon:yes stop_codon:yes gene_type:complete
MEVFILLVVIVLIYLTLNSKKQTFKNITYETDIGERFKEMIDNIEKSINNKKEIYYRFKVSDSKIYYSNILEDCNSPFVLENINTSQSLFSYINSLTQILLDHSNKTTRTNLHIINVDNFKRDTIANGFSYKIEVFLLDHKKYSTNKYRIHLHIVNGVVKVNSVDIINAVEPHKRFNCDDKKKKHCSGRDSSLQKKEANIEMVEAIVETRPEVGKVDEPNKYIQLNATKSKLLKDHILLPNEPDRAVYPCKKIEHTWDSNGVSNNDEDETDCYGNKYALAKKNPEPFYHVSILNNRNFDSQNIDINHNFRWQNRVGHDH